MKRRREEIIDAGIEYTLQNRPMCMGGDSFFEEMREMNRNKSFEAGAKWADKTMIEKACDWLSKTLYIHIEEIEDKHWNETETFDWVTSDYDSVSDFIDGFRKAMEE